MLVVTSAGMSPAFLVIAVTVFGVSNPLVNPTATNAANCANESVVLDNCEVIAILPLTLE